jgi:aminoglycoside phosphotransferase family enzyme/predicted kinase
MADAGGQVTAISTSQSANETVAAVIAHLERMADDPQRPHHVEHIETHLSDVLLTADRVYKLLKPVRFAFVDFSTVERRREECQAEVELNRPLAADVYLAAEPVVQSASGEIAGIGCEVDTPGATVVDWVVVMRRLPSDQTLEALVHRGKATAAHVEDLTRVLVDYYALASRATISASEYRAAVERHVRDNLAELSRAEHGLPRCEVVRVHAAQLAVLAFGQAWFDARVQSGKIVAGHGDLRPEHVYFTPSPVVIDCLAFSRELRTLDVADEIAFLAMELRRMGAEALAADLLAAFEIQAGDSPSAPLWAFYQSYRACVRAKVAVLRAAQVGSSPAGAPQRNEQRTLARAYLDLADRLARQLHPPACIVVRGLSGTGKSTLAAALAEKLGALHLQTDLIRKRLFPSAGAATYGQGCYTSAARKLVYDALFAQAREALAQGRPVVLDGTFLSTCSRQTAADLAEKHGTTAAILTCVCPQDVAAERLTARASQHATASDATLATRHHQAGEEEPDPVGISSVPVDTTQSLDAQVEQACTAIQLTPGTCECR